MVVVVVWWRKLLERNLAFGGVDSSGPCCLAIGWNCLAFRNAIELLL
jgi:hypothetical protein